MKLSELAKEIGAQCTAEAEITGIRADSRLVEAGDLFICLEGMRMDAQKFVPEAVSRGAAAVLTSHDLGGNIPQLVVSDAREGFARVSAAFYGHPERTLTTVGVTGTNGKTTVTHMIYEILRAEGRKAGLIGTLGARFGNAVLPPILTTPDPPQLFSILAGMKRVGTEVAVMEVSAHALALKKVCPIRYDVAIFTNLTQDHLDFFGDMQSYGAAKAGLFTREMCREAVLNADDPFSRTLRVRGATYGLECPADNFAIIEEEQPRATRMLLNLEDELVEVTLAMAGRHNVYNALAAAVCAKKLGVENEAIAAGLARTRVEGRLEHVGEKDGADIFVDFAHTPDGLQKSLGALRPFCKGRLIVLFGCGGNRDAAKRPRMGEVAANLSDFAVLTSDNPRYEDPVAILSAIEEGFRPVSRQYVVIEEREEATRYAIGLLGEGDILLIAGKGGEETQESMGIKYAYNDKTIVRKILGKGSCGKSS